MKGMNAVPEYGTRTGQEREEVRGRCQLLASTPIFKSPGNWNIIQNRMASQSHSALYDVPI